MLDAVISSQEFQKAMENFMENSINLFKNSFEEDENSENFLNKLLTSLGENHASYEHRVDRCMGQIKDRLLEDISKRLSKNTMPITMGSMQVIEHLKKNL